jgi:DNA adenine methylase
VQIENRDYEFIIDRFDKPDTLFYLDPPYVSEGDALYTGEAFDHSRFYDVLADLNGDAIVSYTDVPDDFSDWYRIEMDQAQHMSKGRGVGQDTERTERLLFNFDPTTRSRFQHANQTTLGTE